MGWAQPGPSQPDFQLSHVLPQHLLPLGRLPQRPGRGLCLQLQSVLFPLQSIDSETVAG